MTYYLISQCMYQIFSIQADGEPIPNVRWYVDKTIIEEEDNQHSDEQINIMKYSKSNSNIQGNSRKEQKGDVINPSPSSFPFFVEETSSADIYSLDNGKLYLILPVWQNDIDIIFQC